MANLNTLSVWIQMDDLIKSKVLSELRLSTIMCSKLVMPWFIIDRTQSSIFDAEFQVGVITDKFIAWLTDKKISSK